jgi:hypothetical protein
MNRYDFYLRITADQYLDYYRGMARIVLVRCTSGQNVQCPASLLQQFVTSEGICGHLPLTCDKDHRNSHLEEGVTKGVTRYAALLEFWEIFAGVGFAGSRRFMPVQRELFRP